MIETDRSFLAVSWMEKSPADELFADARLAPFVAKPPLTLYGKNLNQPRDVAFLSDAVKEYKYSGYSAPATKLTPPMKKLLSDVNGQLGASFCGILANRYNDGNDYISMHSDKIGDCDERAGVFSVSLGGNRLFVVKRKSDGKEWQVPMTHGMVLHMGGAFQDEFTHGVPKQKNAGLRINLTLRAHNTKSREKEEKNTFIKKQIKK